MFYFEIKNLAVVECILGLGFKPSAKIYEKNCALLNFFIPEQKKLFRNTTL